MRKLVAISTVALLALTMAFALVGCGRTGTEQTTSEPPPAESSMEGGMMAESLMADTMTAH